MFTTGGQFQAYMQVHIQNDGPVTLDIDSPSIPPPKERKPQGPPKKQAQSTSKKSSDEVVIKETEKLDITERKND